MVESGINGQRLLALLNLRAKLMLRQYRGEPGRIIVAIFGLLLFLPMTGGLAIASWIAYVQLPQPWPAELLGLVLVFLWLAWISLPIFAVNVNEGLDITRLLLYPLTRSELLVAMLFGTLFDFPTYLMAPFFVAMLLGWGQGLALPIVAIALFMAYGQMILASQLVLNTAGGILRSRRFRDLFIVLSALIGSSCFLIQQGIGPLAMRVIQPGQDFTLRPLVWLQWLPPGSLARAIEQAHQGAWVPSLLWLTYGGLWLAFLGFLWWWVTTRVITGQGFLLNLGGREKTQQHRASPAGAILAALLPPDLLQLAAKEWKTGWRTPRRRVALLQMFIMPLFMALAFTWNISAINPEAQFNRATVAIFALPAYSLFIFWIISQNILGWEGKGFHFLLLTPIPRWRIFLAKGLTILVIGLVPLTGLSLLLFAWSKSPTVLLGLPAAIAVGLVTLAMSFLISTLFPFPIDLEGLQPRASLSGGGCLTGLANVLLTPLLTFVFNLPIALLFIYGRSLKGALVPLILGSGSLIYGILLFGLMIVICGWYLQLREPEIIAATRPRQKN